MVESALKFWNLTAKSRDTFFLRTRFVPPGIWIIAVVLVFVGGRWLWSQTGRPEHVREIATACGSAYLLDNVAQFDGDLSHFTFTSFAKTRGVDLVLFDATTGQKRQVTFQEDGAGPFRDLFSLQAYSWSPDGRSFTYSKQGKLYICALGTNLPTAELNANPSSLVWLNRSEMAWMEDKTICHAKKAADGEWTVQRFDAHAEVKSLTAIDSHRIAWLQDDCICQLDLSQDLSGNNNPFLSSSHFDNSPVTNNLMLWFDASTLQQADRSPVTALEDLGPARNGAVVNGNSPFFNAPGNGDSLNGKGTIHFASNGGAENSTGLKTMRPLGLTGATPRTAFAVIRRNYGSQLLINMGQPGVRGAYFCIGDRQNGLYLPGTWNVDNVISVKPRQWNILAAIYDGNSVKGYVNGTFEAEKKVALDTTDKNVEIGLRTGTSATGSDGDFAELLVYDRALDTEECQQVEGYLRAKWFGIQQFSHNSKLIWIDPRMDHLASFSYSPQTGELLIKRTENGKDTLWRLATASGSSGQPTLVPQSCALTDVQMQWTGSNSFVFASGKMGNRSLFITGLSDEQSRPLIQHADIRWFQITPDYKKILMGAVMSNEPAMGIWQYELGSGQLHSVIPYSENPSPFATEIKPFIVTCKLRSGRTVTLSIFPPANFNPQKKYPLVLGDTYVPDPIYGQRLQSGIAACGAFVVFVDRKNNWGTDIGLWEESVRDAYEQLRKDPCIDADRTYLIAASAETQYLSDCLEKTPGLWRGAIFLNPSLLPDFSKSPLLQHRPKILITAGGEEGAARFKTYQQNALQSGALVEYVIHPGEGHRLVGTTSTESRLQTIARFIFEE